MSTENNNSKNINNITSSSINPEFLVTWTKQSEVNLAPNEAQSTHGIRKAGGGTWRKNYNLWQTSVWPFIKNYRYIDIPSLDVEGTKYLTEKLELKWKNEIEIGRVRSSKSRLRNAVLRALDKYLLSLIVLLANLETLRVMIQPVLLSFLLAEMSNNSPVDMGMLLVYYDKRSNFENFYVSRPNFWPFYG